MNILYDKFCQRSTSFMCDKWNKGYPICDSQNKVENSQSTAERTRKLSILLQYQTETLHVSVIFWLRNVIIIS